MVRMDAFAGSLITTFDYVWTRLADRLHGLTDDEYFWEPVPDCWSLRQAADGRWRLDGNGGGGPAPDPAPVTTIAWRLGHLGGLAVGGFSNRLFGDAKLTPDQIAYPATAAAVPDFLAGHYQSWHAGLTAMPQAEWLAPLGPSWGPYAESTKTDLALHVLDEVIHHSAEVALLRDLYARRSSLGAGRGQPR
jgi:hypothetical protein